MTQHKQSLITLAFMLGATLLLSACNEGGSTYTATDDANVTIVDANPTESPEAHSSTDTIEIASNDANSEDTETNTNKNTESTDIPNILWEEREQYESEGQLAFFTDCGLYKDGTDELTGAKCEFKNGEWVLLWPELEPEDNLIENGDFQSPIEKIIDWEINNYKIKFDTMPISSSMHVYCEGDLDKNNIHYNNLEYGSSPYSLQVNSNDKKIIILNTGNNNNFSNKFITSIFHVKKIKGDNDISFNIREKNNQYNLSGDIRIKKRSNNFQEVIATKRTSGQLKVLNPIFIEIPENSAYLMDDIFSCLGYFPMGISSMR